MLSYIDGATGTYLFTMLASGVAGFGYFVRISFRKFRRKQKPEIFDEVK